MGIIKRIKFKGLDIRIPFLTLKFETQQPTVRESGKANNYGPATMVGFFHISSF
jgi:hypothetical protein